MLSGAGRLVARTLVHTDARQPSPWLLVMVHTEEGVRLTGFGDADLAIGDHVKANAMEDGVPYFVEEEGAA